MPERLRKLHIDGRTFVWKATIRHVPGEGDCHRGIRLRVWGSGKNGRILQADLLSKSWPGPWGACATDDAYPTLADVRTVIGYGLKHGWDPDARGGFHLLTERDHDWELPGFLLTDRLLDPTAPDPTNRVIHAYEQRTAGATQLDGSAGQGSI
ncbi:hypothetical protein [Actinomadura sp. 9N407]|uniref:hypothetical protein n=1 Tax=Actinomadura sp. 9N407 TaxID=3375154 RepID=UPI0037A87D5F